MWDFQMYRKVMGVWGSWSSPSPVKMNSLLCLTANFPVSCPCVHGFSYSQPGPAQCKGGFVHNWVFGIVHLSWPLPWQVSPCCKDHIKVLSTFRWGQAEQQEKWSHWMLMYLQQVSHSTVISIQAGRPGLFMKPGAHHKRVTENPF